LKTVSSRLILSAITMALACGVTGLLPNRVKAQVPYPFATPTTPTAQRSAMTDVKTQMGYFRNTTRTASSFATGAYEMVWGKFQVVRASFNALKATLRPDQLAGGANELAELDEGLNILQEAFDGYQQEMAAGRSGSMALRSMCRVLDQAAGVWLQEFDKDCGRLRVGWL
jgi:hypothetical protein